MDIEAEVKTEEQLNHYLRSVEDLKNDVFSLLSGSPLPLTSCKRTTIQVKYNPKTSETKETELYITLGAGIKKDKEQEIEKICSEYEPRRIEECIRNIEREIET